MDTYVDEAAQSLGVADPERLATMAENRLRAARLHRPDKLGGILTIEVEALDDEPINVYSVAVDFQRIMINPFTAQGTAETTPPLEPDRFAAVTVWHDGTIGYFTDMANAPANSVRTAASDAIDEFVRDYLRVNEMACVSN